MTDVRPEIASDPNADQDSDHLFTYDTLEILGNTINSLVHIITSGHALVQGLSYQQVPFRRDLVVI